MNVAADRQPAASRRRTAPAQEAELSNLYGARHPKMQQLEAEKANIEAKINAEVSRITSALQNDVAVTQARVSAMESQLDGMKTQTDDNRDGRGQAARAAAAGGRQPHALRSLPRPLQADRRAAGDRRAGCAAGLDRHPPIQPSTPGTKLFTAAGLRALLRVCSSLLALFLDRLDRGLRSAREVEAALGLPTLALVPRLDKLKRNQKPYQYLMEKPLSAYTEFDPRHLHGAQARQCGQRAQGGADHLVAARGGQDDGRGEPRHLRRALAQAGAADRPRSPPSERAPGARLVGVAAGWSST